MPPRAFHPLIPVTTLIPANSMHLLVQLRNALFCRFLNKLVRSLQPGSYNAPARNN